jgi:hypothetical protein
MPRIEFESSTPKIYHIDAFSEARYNESKGFLLDTETEKGKNIFSVMLEIEILVMKNARVGFSAIGKADHSLASGKTSYFKLPSKLASQSFAFSIFFLIEEIINSSLKSMGNSKSIDIKCIKAGILENQNLKYSLILLKIIESA